MTKSIFFHWQIVKTDAFKQVSYRVVLPFQFYTIAFEMKIDCYWAQSIFIENQIIIYSVCNNVLSLGYWNKILPVLEHDISMLTNEIKCREYSDFDYQTMHWNWVILVLHITQFTNFNMDIFNCCPCNYHNSVLRLFFKFMM